MGTGLGGSRQRTPPVRIPESRFEGLYEDSDIARKDMRKMYQDLIHLPGVNVEAEYHENPPSTIILNERNRGFAGVLDVLTGNSTATVEVTENNGEVSAKVYADEDFDHVDGVNEIVGEYLEEDKGSFGISV